MVPLGRTSDGHSTDTSKHVVCLIAVAWVLEVRGFDVIYYHNDYLPCFSVNGLYYDITVPTGTAYMNKLHMSIINKHRDSGLAIVYNTYLAHDFEGTDFINAFSIIYGGALFPYDPQEEYQ